MHTRVMRHVLGTSVGDRGQITIEREIRDKLGIKPRDIAVQRVQHGRLLVEFVRPHEPHMRSLVGILGPSPRQAHGPLNIDDAVGRSIAEEWHQSGDGQVADDGEEGGDGVRPARPPTGPSG